MKHLIVLHSLLPPKTLPPVNTPVVCVFAEYNACHIKVIRFRTCTYTQLPNAEGDGFDSKWVLHNAVGNPQVYPLAWVDFTATSISANDASWLAQLHKFGKVDFIYSSID